CVLENGEVELLEAGAMQRVASFAAEVARAGDAVGFVRGPVIVGVSKGARSGECRQVYVLSQIAGIVLRSSNLVRPVKAFARAGVLSFKLVVEVPGLTILQVEDAVQAPAVLQPLHRAARLGELVNEVPSKAAANVEAGISPISCRVRAVRRL